MPSFQFATPVRFADVDHAGIVYYPRYFHYFHLCFEELWRQRMGAAAYQSLLDDDRIGFPAVRAECEYRGPLRFGDTAEIELSIARLGQKSIDFRYQVWRADSPEAKDPSRQHRALCAEGRVVTAVVDLARFVAIPVPGQVLSLLADLTPGVAPTTSG